MINRLEVIVVVLVRLIGDVVPRRLAEEALADSHPDGFSALVLLIDPALFVLVEAVGREASRDKLRLEVGVFGSSPRLYDDAGLTEVTDDLAYYVSV